MWNSKTEIRFRTKVNPTKKKHLEILVELFSIPDRGILIILDSDDYKEYFNPIWKNQGLHLDIKNGGVEEMSPEYLLEIMESGEYSNLVAKDYSHLISFVFIVGVFEYRVFNSKKFFLSGYSSASFFQEVLLLATPYNYDILEGICLDLLQTVLEYTTPILGSSPGLPSAIPG
jgi:hypothetical protein